MGRTKGGSTRRRLAVDAHVRPVRAQLTAGTVADCSQAISLLKDLDVQFLLADKGYDANTIWEYAQEHGILTVIPPRRSRQNQRDYDKNLYKQRRLIENTFLYLKRWRGIATRYAKNAASFLAAIHIRCIALILAHS